MNEQRNIWGLMSAVCLHIKEEDKMKTINKEQLQIFASYMEDEIPLSVIEEFIKAKARVKELEMLEFLNPAPLELNA